MNDVQTKNHISVIVTDIAIVICFFAFDLTNNDDVCIKRVCSFMSVSFCIFIDLGLIL